MLRPWPFTILLDDLRITIDPHNLFSAVTVYRIIVEHVVTRKGMYIMVSKELMDDWKLFPTVLEDLIERFYKS